jgi:hypothetical protein
MNYWMPQQGDEVTVHEKFDGAVVLSIKINPKMAGGGEATLVYPEGVLPRGATRSRVAVGALWKCENGVRLNTRGKL